MRIFSLKDPDTPYPDAASPTIAVTAPEIRQVCGGATPYIGSLRIYGQFIALTVTGTRIGTYVLQMWNRCSGTLAFVSNFVSNVLSMQSTEHEY